MLLTRIYLYDKFILVSTEEYPSPAEGIGLENRQGCQNPRGFESLFLLHNLKLISYLAHKIWEIDKTVTIM